MLAYKLLFIMANTIYCAAIYHRCKQRVVYREKKTVEMAGKAQAEA